MTNNENTNQSRWLEGKATHPKLQNNYFCSSEVLLLSESQDKMEITVLSLNADECKGDSSSPTQGQRALDTGTGFPDPWALGSLGFPVLRHLAMAWPWPWP